MNSKWKRLGGPHWKLLIGRCRVSMIPVACFNCICLLMATLQTAKPINCSVELFNRFPSVFFFFFALSRYFLYLFSLFFLSHEGIDFSSWVCCSRYESMQKVHLIRNTMAPRCHIGRYSTVTAIRIPIEESKESKFAGNLCRISLIFYYCK